MIYITPVCIIADCFSMAKIIRSLAHLHFVILDVMSPFSDLFQVLKSQLTSWWVESGTVWKCVLFQRTELGNTDAASACFLTVCTFPRTSCFRLHNHICVSMFFPFPKLFVITTAYASWWEMIRFISYIY